MILLTFGIGLTVIVKVTGAPLHDTPPFVYVGVIVIVELIGVLPVLVVTNDGMFPVPLAANPIAVLELVQLYTVPGTKPVGVTTVVLPPTQIVWLATALTVGIGLTAIVNDVDTPVQPRPALVYTGVAVIVPEIVAFVVLVVTNEAMSPTPGVPRPIAALVLLQLYTVPATLPVNVTPVVVEPLQITWLLILLTFGIGLTVMVTVNVPPAHVPAAPELGVTV